MASTVLPMLRKLAAYLEMIARRLLQLVDDDPTCHDRHMSSKAQRLIADAVITCRAAVEVHRPGFIDVDADGRVKRSGSLADAPPTEDAVTRMSGLLMPGLINSHAHGPMTLLRGVGDGLPLERWLTEAIWPREGKLAPGDVAAGMLLASVEMLLAGVTASCEMYFADDELLDAVDASGGRVMCTPGVVGVAHLANFYEPTGRLAEIATLHASRHEPEGRLRVGVAPHSAYDLPLAVVDDLAGLARDLDCPLHIHIAETGHEGRDLEEVHGKRTVEVLAERGVLDGHVLAAHGVWLNDAEVELFASHGTHVAHCPKSNLKLGSGVARLHDLITAGVNVGLGTDGVASNDDLDLWQELQLAPLLARGTSGDPTRITAEQALLMATRHGAEAIGMPDTGTLTPGSWADIIRVDLSQPAFTPIITDDDLVDRLVFAGGSRYVTDTWVAGQRVVEAGASTTVDTETALADAQTRAERLAAAV